jgi:hypothetical protein
LAEGAGVEPTGAFRLRQFSGLPGVPVPNLPGMTRAPGFEPGSAGLESASLPLTYAPSSMHQEGIEPPRPAGATALQTAAEPFRPLMRVSFKRAAEEKLDEGGGGSPPSSPQGISVVKQQKERAGRLSSPTGSRPAPDKSLRTF